MKAKNTSTWDLRILMFYIHLGEVRGEQPLAFWLLLLFTFPEDKQLWLITNFNHICISLFLTYPFRHFLQDEIHLLFWTWTEHYPL